MTISNEMLGAAKIKVLGVGGGGCNAITRMYKQRIVGVEIVGIAFIARVFPLLRFHAGGGADG